MSFISAGDSESGAVFSQCERYRYRLWRYWDHSKSSVLFIMLNPSTADETKLDPTVTRCVSFAKAWGYGAVEVCNIFAYRATDPQEMRAQANPVGFHNDDIIVGVANNTLLDGGRIICAWGQHGKFMDRGNAVRKLLNDEGVPLDYLRMGKDNQPWHPLYLPKSIEPKSWA